MYQFCIIKKEMFNKKSKTDAAFRKQKIMKKVIVVIALVFAFVAVNFNQASAQVTNGKAALLDVPLTNVQLANGNNAVPLPKGQGTLRFMYVNGQILNVMHQDAAGRIVRLPESTEGCPNTPNCPGKKQECMKNTETGSAAKFCMPTDLTDVPREGIEIGLLLPAIQRVREAAARN
jgi:hypothetical protein